MSLKSSAQRLKEKSRRADEVAPLFGGVAVGAFGEHFGGEFCCQVSDFIEVAVFWDEGFAVRVVIGVLP
jgi:hypothetical protein